mmetsp:Transcript_8863/g.8252  ORF Transcript_8863/g.8252 Transcript_8863/m.8252 type:complete len:105 (+) Transcript_8863:6642-6956(+)
MGAIQTSTNFRDEYMKKIPLFVIDKQLYIETNIKKDKVELTDSDRKFIINGHKNFNSFIIYTISLLSRSCLFIKGVEKNPFSNDDLNFVPDQDELSLLTSHQNE